MSHKTTFENGIGLKEIAEPDSLSGYGRIWFDTNGIPWVKNGSGAHEVLLAGHNIGEMYLYANETESIIDTADAWHLLPITALNAGELDGWTFEEGVRGTDIIAYATYDAGASTLVTTTAAHNLSAGDFISITGTANYNALYEVLSAPSTTTFEINKAWDTNNDATGTYSRGGTLIAGATAGGAYKIGWNVTVTPETNGHVFTGTYSLNGVVCTKCRSRAKLGTAADYSNLGASSLRLAEPIVAGDKIQFAFKNVGASGNFTGRHGNLNVHRI